MRYLQVMDENTIPLSHDQPRSRACHCGEDGLASISDEKQLQPLAGMLWSKEYFYYDVEGGPLRDVGGVAEMAQIENVRVMIVDDHPIVRNGIGFALKTFEDIDVVGDASNGEEAVRMCDEQHPDVVLMDMVMPGMDGVAATRAIRRDHPDTQVLALTSFSEPALVRGALQAGAIGYMLKNVSIEELALAIRAAQAGKSTLAKEAVEALYTTEDRQPGGDQLTARQREVLDLVVEGKSNKEIARELSISLATARSHVSLIFDKLGAANRAEAAARAVRNRYVD